MAAGLSWSWSTAGAGCCVVISLYLPGRCCEKTKSDLGRLSEKSCLNQMAAAIGLVDYAGSTVVTGWIPCFLLQLVVRMQTLRLAAWFGGEDTNPMLLEEETNISPMGLGEPGCPVFISHCLPLDRTWHTVNDLKVDYRGCWGKERLGWSQDSNPAVLCWSLAHLVQCEPDEPCRTWIQTWVQARMPDYSLNWTKRSSAIQCYQKHYSPPKGGSAKTGSHSVLNLSLTCDGSAKPKPSCPVDFWLQPAVYIALSCYYTAGSSEVFLYTGSSFIEYK